MAGAFTARRGRHLRPWGVSGRARSDALEKVKGEHFDVVAVTINAPRLGSRGWASWWRGGVERLGVPFGFGTCRSRHARDGRLGGSHSGRNGPENVRHPRLNRRAGDPQRRGQEGGVMARHT